MKCLFHNPRPPFRERMPNSFMCPYPVAAIVHIYTDDKEQLLAHAARAGDRQSALELVGKTDRTQDPIQQHIRDTMERAPLNASRTKGNTQHAPRKDRDYEPGL